jgi:hypothetical protein
MKLSAFNPKTLTYYCKECGGKLVIDVEMKDWKTLFGEPINFRLNKKVLEKVVKDREDSVKKEEEEMIKKEEEAKRRAEEARKKAEQLRIQKEQEFADNLRKAAEESSTETETTDTNNNPIENEAE